MPNESLTPAEVAILLALMVEAREISNNELDELHGFRLTGTRRTKLNNLKLVDTRTDVRPHVHKLTKSGWDRCREEVAAGRPKGAGGTAFGALYAVLAGLNRFIERDEINLEYVFQATATEPTSSEVEVAVEQFDPAPVSATDDLEERIRDAYKQLVRRPGGWVSLAELRPLLGDASRAEVDRELKRMDRIPGISVIPEENQKTLTREERDAAVMIGGKDNHLIAIEDA